MSQLFRQISPPVGKFVKIGVCTSPNYVVVSWLRLIEASDCIPHPYRRYIKCFVILIWCEWTYGCTPYTVIPVQVGVKLLKNWSMCKPQWEWGVMDEAARGFRLHPTSMLDVYIVLEHLDMLWMGIWVHPYTVMPVQVDGGFLDNGGVDEPKWCYNVMVEA